MPNTPEDLSLLMQVPYNQKKIISSGCQIFCRLELWKALKIWFKKYGMHKSPTPTLNPKP
jgi:hypothetical protein